MQKRDCACVRTRGCLFARARTQRQSRLRCGAVEPNIRGISPPRHCIRKKSRGWHRLVLTLNAIIFITGCELLSSFTCCIPRVQDYAPVYYYVNNYKWRHALLYIANILFQLFCSFLPKYNKYLLIK